ncbi:hypothetical protein TWF694_005640 [Orbilia ellipsospora]|uniref:Uncharacterized protein n=1 Tax=Orbilia ellipsospora TaxID=2528407 RepID=A0AAV9WTR5_9PEZI
MSRVSTPRRLTAMDIRFQQVLDSSPMPKSIRRVYESLGAQQRERLEEVARKHTAGLRTPKLHPGIINPPRIVIATPVPNAQSKNNTDSQESDPDLGHANQAGKKENQAASSSLENQSLEPVSSDKSTEWNNCGTESNAPAGGISGHRKVITASRRRKSARRSGPRDYWILGSRRRNPVYDESVLRKPWKVH